MIRWRQHRLWIGILGCAVVLATASGPLLGMAQQKAAQKLADLRKENDKAAQALRQLQEDIASAEHMKGQIDAREAEKDLAPTDRLRAARIIEQRASEAHLSHFTYTLSPEQKTAIDTVGSGRQELATSKLTLSADAPTDTDAYIFLDALIRTLPGRLALQHITVQRIADDAPVSDANLRLTASAEWLSNGAGHVLAEAP